MEDRIYQAVRDALAAAGAPDVAFAVEWPADPAHGDYAVNAALAAAKSLGKNPREVAEHLVPAIKEALGVDAASVAIAGPGFVNITLSPEAIAAQLAPATEEGWGGGSANADKKV